MYTTCENLKRKYHVEDLGIDGRIIGKMDYESA
jgi:hypothetical protein